MTTRKLTAMLVSTAMLSTSFSASIPVQAQQQRRASQGYCRTSSALPMLGREVENDQEQLRPEMRRSRGDEGIAAPPPSPIPSPYMDAPSTAESSVVVTGTRREGAASDTPPPP
ncbi:MAG: hypothetical protein ABL909_04340, partial [Sphingopyxis sp.]